jgi:hypothetical protein
LNAGTAAADDLANTQEHRTSFAAFTATSARISESEQPAADAMTPELTQLNADKHYQTAVFVSRKDALCLIQSFFSHCCRILGI